MTETWILQVADSINSTRKIWAEIEDEKMLNKGDI
jgi:hypothetical protein